VKRRSAVVAFGMVLVGVIAAGQVIAATPVQTSVTILNGNGERFTGRVTSPKKACLKGRSVTLYMAVGPRRDYVGYPGFEAVGKATTRSNGNWKVNASEEAFLEGNYRAFVAAKRVKVGDESLLCMARWGPTRHA
jgi:hypothetical protein